MMPLTLIRVAEASIATLQAMNPLIKVSAEPDLGLAASSWREEALKKYDTVVASGLSLTGMEALESICKREL